MKSIDVRRLWEKLHNADTRDKCYTYYREATFEKSKPIVAKRGGFMRNLAAKSTEFRVVLATAGVLGLGVGVISLMAWTSQSSSADRVDAYLENLGKNWKQYQNLTKDK
jgi:hypothetical protein